MSELKEISCDECGGEGFLDWSYRDLVGIRECDCCGGYGILRVPVEENG